MSQDWQKVRQEIRQAIEKGDLSLRKSIVRKLQLENWEDATRFCGLCGSPMMTHTPISRICTSCGHEIFPQLSPAIVVLVLKDGEALLVHNKSFRNDNHALVAGFIEPGETAEECVAREVKEETDLEICNIRYVATESWPFPGQLMMGFVADYAGGELRFADAELDKGRFFSRDELPPVPDSASLSGRIIRKWINGEL